MVRIEYGQHIWMMHWPSIAFSQHWIDASQTQRADRCNASMVRTVSLYN